MKAGISPAQIAHRSNQILIIRCAFESVKACIIGTVKEMLASLSITSSPPPKPPPATPHAQMHIPDVQGHASRICVMRRKILITYPPTSVDEFLGQRCFLPLLNHVPKDGYNKRETIPSRTHRRRTDLQVASAPNTKEWLLLHGKFALFDAP